MDQNTDPDEDSPFVPSVKQECGTALTSGTYNENVHNLPPESMGASLKRPPSVEIDEVDKKKPHLDPDSSFEGQTSVQIDDADYEIDRTSGRRWITYNGGARKRFDPDDGDEFVYWEHESYLETASDRKEYHLSQQHTRQALKVISDALMGLGEELGDEVGKLAEGINRVAKMPVGKTVQIAIVGAAGDGKSTFINALLGYKTLATRGGDGKSVTQVVTEFHSHDEEDVVMDVLFKSQEEVDREVHRQLRSYFDFKRPEDPQNCPDEDAEEDTLRTAEDFIVGVFGPSEPRRFGSRDLLENYVVSELSPDTVDAFISEMQRKCREIVITALIRQSGDVRERSIMFREPKDRVAELKEKVQPYIELPMEGSLAYWQLVDRMQTWLPSPFLAKGIVLADCPGLSDWNGLRCEAARRWIRETDKVLILSNVSRIEDNKTTSEIVATALRNKTVDDIVIVPTQIDNNVDEAPINRKDPFPGIEAKLQSCYKDLEEAQKAGKLAHERQRRSKQNKNRHTPQGKREVREASRENKKAVGKIKKLERRRISLWIEHRNKIQLAGIREKVLPRDQRAIKDSLRVIPTSSIVHLKYMNRTWHGDLPALTVQDDGIGKIRNLLRSWAQVDCIENLHRYVVEEAELVVRRLQMVLRKNKKDREAQVFADVDKTCMQGPEHHVEACEGAILSIFRNSVAHKINDTFRAGGPESKHLEDIYHCWYANYGGYAVTFRAIARRNGIHRPSGKMQLPPANFNRDIVTVVNPGLRDLTKAVHDELPKHQLSLKAETSMLLDRLRQCLCFNANIDALDRERFLASFDIYRAQFERSIDSIFLDLSRDIRDLAIRIADDDEHIVDQNTNAKSEFWQVMHKIYQQLLDKTKVKPGPGVNKRRWVYLLNKLKTVGNGTPLLGLKKSLLTRFTKTVEDAKRQLNHVVKLPFDEVRVDIKHRFGQHDSTLSPRAKAKINEALEHVLPQVEQQFDLAKGYLREVREWHVKHIAHLDDDDDVPGVEGAPVDQSMGVSESDDDHDDESLGTRDSESVVAGDC